MLDLQPELGMSGMMGGMMGGGGGAMFAQMLGARSGMDSWRNNRGGRAEGGRNRDRDSSDSDSEDGLPPALVSCNHTSAQLINLALVGRLAEGLRQRYSTMPAAGGRRTCAADSGNVLCNNSIYSFFIPKVSNNMCVAVVVG
jgi:hypothetical protein